MRTVRVPVVGTSVPQNLQDVIVELEAAGQRIVRVVQSPWNPVSITWNGLDAYGRRVNGAVSARISIDYEFLASYSAGSGGQSLGNPTASGASLGAVTGDRRVGKIVWNRQTISLGAPGTASDGLGGWTLGPHHFYDNTGQGTVYLGDGSVIWGDLFGPIARLYSGSNSYCSQTDVSDVANLIE